MNEEPVLDRRRFLECCCTDALEAMEAQAGGASRIELCEDLPCGGVTPSIENLREVLSSVSIPVNVLVRPRGGDFVYSEEEICTTIASIATCRKAGVNGVVVGALRKDGSVDMEAMVRFMQAAEGLEVTFHRAFDECSDPFRALEDIISLGCGRLLTAGHASNVMDGILTLKELNARSARRIIVMAGSGVRPGNIAHLEAVTGLAEFHSSAHGPQGRTSRDVVAAMCRVSPA
ncbi:MAG: copper homeostasis protein CutC [Bacteroidales bacterium]|nr:copper homeostasis protein CutC [Bacteroidales bacterium]